MRCVEVCTCYLLSFVFVIRTFPSVSSDIQGSCVSNLIRMPGVARDAPIDESKFGFVDKTGVFVIPRGAVRSLFTVSCGPA